MKLSKKLTTVTPLSKFLAMVLFIILPFIGLYLGINYQRAKQAIEEVNSIQKVKEIYPECIADRCPTFFQIDATYSNSSPETAIIIPMAMNQGAGKLVIIEKGGKKLFDSGVLPQVGIESVSDGNGFILKYSTPRDESFNTEDFEVRYVWDEDRFIEK